MRRKKWCSAGVCAILAFSLCLMGGQTDSLVTVGYAQEEVQKSKEKSKSTEAPTEAPKPMEKPTEAPTEAPKPTEKPTEALTEAPKPTEKPTEAPTEAPKPTEKPTEVPTEAPKPTEKPTEAPTEAPKPTEKPTEAPTEAPSETVPETPGETENPGGETEAETGESETLPPESETQMGESETIPAETESLTEETETETESESETETESESETETETETESESETEISNEELIARQNIVIPPDIALEFRFTQVDKVFAVVKNHKGANIYEEKSDSAAVAGKIAYYGICYILAEEEEDFVYIESGDVRGFIAAKDILFGDSADRLVKARGEENLPVAQETLVWSENDAYTYTHTTTKDVVVPKVYALAERSLSIREEGSVSSREVGTLEEGGLCYILADRDRDWIFVESGDSRGFVPASDLSTGSEVRRQVDEKGEASFAVAETKISPQDNKACYYTLTSVKEASQEALIRSEMVNFAFQFLGNPYVWGGTSLTDGCDCSGFTQSIYANFGYALPRVAEAQAVYGMQIPIASAAPGDLIFYAKNGSVYHVSMYIGEGQVIHAAGRSTGIIISGIGSNAVWATRIIR